MLSREDHLMIKQMRTQGAYIIDIARYIGCSERTVRRHLMQPEPTRCTPSRRRMTKLEPYMAFIDTRLSEHVWNAQVIFQEIKAQGYDGGTTVLREYIQPKRRLRHGRETVRFETQPGYQLQHDWGEVDAEVAGRPCKINFAVNTLGYSRRFHVFAAPSQDAEHTYGSLVQAFDYFGGSVKTVLVDNQKAAVLKHSFTGEVVFNAGFQSLAKHYSFMPRACRPHRPRTKGKVERMVGYVKHNFFVHYRQFDSFAHVNQLLNQWLAQEADQRHLRQFHQTPLARFEVEKSALQPLPAGPFDTSYYDTRQVGWDGYIDVRGNRYSVPQTWCGRQVTVRITLDNELRVYGDDELIARHQLASDSAGWQTVPEHHQTLWQRTCQVEQRPLDAYEGLL
ncbi:IS21 family transposase [Acerihabitans sp. TG2]|uniref:IS21 family transposase n=1 Tax=Acerihabitans sp. TG2 TaxID=3096008 RepID=UPI002B2223B1|nr:IS21 family transposase [Acerihabitans sp. TG2]MEA9393645.1 IS21 family transposase [Acerihabitans sp. TG2]